MTFLLVHEDREYLLEPGAEQGTDLGVIEVPTDVQPGDVVETHLGEPFVVQKPRGPDLFDHFERTGAPMMPRDIGLLVGHTGASSGDRVLDAGTGTGVLAAYLGRVGADVVTYERNPEFADVARENMAIAGVEDRVDVRTGDLLDVLEGVVADGVDATDGATDIDAVDTEGGADADDADNADDDTEGRADAADDIGNADDASDVAAGTDTSTDHDLAGFDLLTLDTEDAPSVVEHAPDLLRAGGFVAVYSPFVEGTREAHRAAREASLVEVETFETIQRRMQFGDRGSRPDTAGVGHTGYLTFARKP